MLIGEKMENKEYLQIVEKLLENRKFSKLKNETHHHNSNRFNHSVEVSYKTYKICKKLRLDYESATKAALLHDFFFDKEFDNKKERCRCEYKAIAQAIKIHFHKDGDVIKLRDFNRNKIIRNDESPIHEIWNDFMHEEEYNKMEELYNGTSGEN